MLNLRFALVVYLFVHSLRTNPRSPCLACFYEPVLGVLYIVIDAIDLTVAIAIKVASLLTTGTNKVSGVEKSQIKNIAEISPCVPFGHLVEMT